METIFGFKKSKEIKFIISSVEDLKSTMEKNTVRRNQCIIGLKNNDFKLGIAHVSAGLSDEELENSVEAQVAILIPSYDSMDYVTKLLTESQNATEESFLTITIEREKIEEIVQLCKKMRIELIGIYPSFLLDDQKSLEDIVEMIPTITVQEGTVEEHEILLEEQEILENEKKEKTNLIFMQQGAPLNLRQSIKLDLDRSSYNFLGEEYKGEFRKDSSGKAVLLASILIISLQLAGSIYLQKRIGIVKEQLGLTIQNNQKKEVHIKELETQIATIPNLKGKLNKLESIIDNKDSKVNEILYIIKKSSVKGLFIENLKIDRGAISLQGTTETTEALYEFQRKLLLEGLFDIVMSPVVKSDSFYSFSIDAKIK